MDAFETVIGYDGVKEELRQISDSLKHKAVYDALGVSAPHGLLLHGAPGVGKSLMASCLIADSGRKAFACRREEAEEDFADKIREAFAEAASNAPSIVLIDDMDKYADMEKYRPNEEAYAALQDCMDSVWDNDVFVIATSNEAKHIPDSLLNYRHFDRIIEVEHPSQEDARSIFEYYLTKIKSDNNINSAFFARMMNGYSGAEIKSAINSAGLLAGYERADCVVSRHLLLGSLDVIAGIPASSIICERQDDPHDPNCEMTRVAVHEAGHAVVSEIIAPGSVTFVCIHEERDDSRGVVYYHDQDGAISPTAIDVLRPLAGKAAMEIVFGIVDDGAEMDLRKARRAVQNMILRLGGKGLALLESPCEDSTELLAKQEQAAGQELENCYARACEILRANRGFLDKMTVELLKRGILTSEDIHKIKNSV